MLCDIAHTTRVPSMGIFTPSTTRSAALLSQAALSSTGREKRLEDAGVFPRGSRGQRGDPRRGVDGKFAGILQVEIRQRVSRVCMLMSALCKGNVEKRPCLLGGIAHRTVASVR